MRTKAEILERLRENEAVPGKATIGMMEKFRRFPWTQDTMLTVGRMDLILMEYLEKHLAIAGAVLKK